MSVRRCCWPDCPARFPTLRGPATPGWVAIESPRSVVVLCPFHSDDEHRPVISRAESGTVRVGCRCDWPVPRADSLVSGMREWQGHVRASLERPVGVG